LAAVAIEAMDEPRPVRRAETKAVEQPVEMMRDTGAALGRQAWRLVDHDHPVVLIDDHAGEVLERSLVERAGRALRQRFGGIESGRRHTHFLAGNQAQGCGRALAIDADLAGAAQFLDGAL
jgi:hypothetical protein